MSFLYDEKTRKAMKWIWIVIAVLIIVSMVMLYAPGLIPSGGAHTAPVS